MPYQNPYPQGSPRFRMFAYALKLAQGFVRSEPRLEVDDLVHACVPWMDRLEMSWNSRRSSVETWVHRPFVKVMNGCKRSLAPVAVGERRAIRAGRLDRLERTIQADVHKLSRCRPDEEDALLEKVYGLVEEMKKAKVDGAARVAACLRGPNGEPLELEELVAAPVELSGWERDRQWRQIRAALQRLPERERNAVRLRWLEDLTNAMLGPALGLSAQGAGGVARRGLERLRRDLGPAEDWELD